MRFILPRLWLGVTGNVLVRISNQVGEKGFNEKARSLARRRVEEHILIITETINNIWQYP